MLNKKLLRVSPSWNIFDTIYQKYSFSSSSFWWFSNIKHVRVVLHIFFKQILFFRKKVTQRSKFKISPKVLFHSIHDVTQNFFSWKKFRAWISIDKYFRSWSHNVNIRVSQSHSIPYEITVSINFRLLPSI